MEISQKQFGGKIELSITKRGRNEVQQVQTNLTHNPYPILQNQTRQRISHNDLAYM